jgi:catechol 2,3-dioxygenase-like lactoylglutathione lyase family enzyme
MKVYRISAVTLRVKDMEKSCQFYSKLPGFKLVYGGGRATDSFTTFEVGEGSRMYLNLELGRPAGSRISEKDFGRIVFHTEDVDGLYIYMKNDKAISNAVNFESEPADAPWGERFFHIREPDGYQLSFARPLSKAKKYYCE